MITISPKDDFLRDSKRASAHQDLMANPQFQEALKVALLELQVRLLRAPADTAVTTAHRLAGAQALAETLLNLGEPRPPKQEPANMNLQPV
jgi:hypothetical protein